MSYDISLIGPDNEYVASFNITYNVSRMFYSFEPDKGIRSLYRTNGRKSLPWLIGLHKHLLMNREKMLEFEPENGWGTWENTVKCINKMCIVAAENPDCIWEGD